MLRRADGAKGEAASGSNREGESTDAERRGGVSIGVCKPNDTACLKGANNGSPAGAVWARLPAALGTSGWRLWRSQ